MELQGKVITVLQLQQGTSKSTNKEWKKIEFVVDTQEQFSKKCCFTLFGDKVSLCPKVGDEVLVKFDIDAHEYNGRWFNQINAWSVDVKGGQQEHQTEQQATQATQQPAQQTQAQPMQATQQASDNDSLPF